MNRKINEIVKLLDHLRREVEETQGYINKKDMKSAMRNQVASNDELQTLVKRWNELAQQISKG